MIDFYVRCFEGCVYSGVSIFSVADMTALAYLDGKPALRGKHKVTRSERDATFWSRSFLTNLPAQAWQSQSMLLLLAQYMGQERVSNMASSGSSITILTIQLRPMPGPNGENYVQSCDAWC